MYGGAGDSQPCDYREDFPQITTLPRYTDWDPTHTQQESDSDFGQPPAASFKRSNGVPKDGACVKKRNTRKRRGCTQLHAQDATPAVALQAGLALYQLVAQVGLTVTHNVLRLASESLLAWTGTTRQVVYTDTNAKATETATSKLPSSNDDEYEAYSSQSYQLGNFDYEVLVFRKPRS